MLQTCKLVCPLDCGPGNCTSIPGGEYKCICPSLYNGERCEHYLCSKYCKNRATCHVIQPPGKDNIADTSPPQLKCICPPHYTGERCETPINICKNQCLNGGICYISHVGVPQCNCKSGFTGSRCQQCAKLSCLNGGTCARNDGKEKCLCASGFYGKNCEHSTECNDNDNNNQYCMNGGTCRMGINQQQQQPSCVCPPFYTGRKCEVDLCSGNNPAYGCDAKCSCKNQGSCQMLDSKLLCNCTKLWGGEHCEVSNFIRNVFYISYIHDIEITFKKPSNLIVN